MEIKLSEIYKIIYELILKSDTKNINLKSIENEIQTVDEQIALDLNELNKRIQNLKVIFNQADLKSTKEDFVHLRIQVMNIQSYLFNLVESIDEVFLKTDIYKSDSFPDK